MRKFEKLKQGLDKCSAEIKVLIKGFAMNVEIIQRYNKDYFLENYYEWLKYRSKFRKHQKNVGIFLMFLGFILGMIFFFRYNSSSFIFPLVFFFGVGMIFNFYYTKHTWLKERFTSKQNDREIKICFDDNKMCSISEFGSSNLDWSFFTDAIKTEKGLFLLLGNGTSIYIQKSVLHENYMDEIIKHIKN